MPSNTLDLILYPIESVVMIGVFLYAAYFSFLLVRVLAVPIYKSRALWTGIFGTAIALFVGWDILAPLKLVNEDIRPIITWGLLLPVFLAILYAWIDRTISLALRLDYLGRDALQWRKLRDLYWAAVAFLLIPYFLFPYSLQSSINLYVWTPLFVATLAYSVVTLVIAATQTRDSTLRSHLKWFGYFLLTLLLSAITLYFTSSAFFQYLPIVPGGYCFYRMAKSLAPLNRLSPSDLSTPSSILPEK